jgi:hypothetical protein
VGGREKRDADCHARTQQLAGGFKRSRENPRRTRPAKEKAAARAKKRVSSSSGPFYVLSPGLLPGGCVTNSDACPFYLCLSADPLPTCPHKSETTTTIREGRERERRRGRAVGAVVGRVAVFVCCCDCSRIRSRAQRRNPGAWACAAVARGEEEVVSQDRAGSPFCFGTTHVQDRHARVAGWQQPELTNVPKGGMSWSRGSLRADLLACVKTCVDLRARLESKYRLRQLCSILKQLFSKLKKN